MSLSLEEQFDPYSFVKYMNTIGRAYQCQAIELVRSCRLFLEDLQVPEHDAPLQDLLLAADMALHFATQSGKRVTDTASHRFSIAVEIASLYERSVYPNLSTVGISQRMARAREADKQVQLLFNSLRNRGVHTPSELEPWDEKLTIPVNFVLLRSLTDPKPLIVHQILTPQPTIAEILWNFARYTDDRRITLRQNPHFYLDLPTTRVAYHSEFFKDPVKDFVLSRNDIVYVLVDNQKQSHVFLHIGHGCRIFRNVFKFMGGTLIFKDLRGRLQGERLVRRDIFGHTDHCGPLVVLYDRVPDIPDISLRDGSAIRLNHSHVPAIITTFKTWWELMKMEALTSIGVSIHIFCGNVERGSPLVDPPPPPTSERPRYPVLYTTIDGLDDDTLLANHRSENEMDWNV